MLLNQQHVADGWVSAAHSNRSRRRRAQRGQRRRARSPATGGLLRAHGSRQPAPAPSRTATTHRGRPQLRAIPAPGPPTPTRQPADHDAASQRRRLQPQRPDLPPACWKRPASSPAAPPLTTTRATLVTITETAGPTASCPATSRSPACCSTP